MRLTQLDTPALVLDLDAYEQNIRTMQGLLSGTGIALRPHYKSHKCAQIALRQIAGGAKGITCAKLGEALDLAANGIEDILIANQIVSPHKILTLAKLAGKCRLTVCVDNPDNVRALSEAASFVGTTIHCLVEYEVGMKRCGVQTPEAFLALAKTIRQSPSLTFDGIQAYAGHLSHEADEAVRRAEAEAVEVRLRELIRYLKDHEIPVKEVSGASTGTVAYKGRNSVYTEVQAGSYLFMDASYQRLHLPFQNALSLLTTVVSIVGDRVVVDFGVKGCGVDQELPVFERFPDCVPVMSEEHAAVTVPGHECRIGDVLRVLPGHCCTSINLYDKIYLVRGDQVLGQIPVTSRGKCQ